MIYQQTLRVNPSPIGPSLTRRENDAQPPAPEHRRLCEVGHGYGCVHIQSSLGTASAVH
jgi:hypothetical protein